MTDKECAISEALKQIGIAITPRAQAGCGWGWSIENAKIIHDWEGPYATATDAAGAALDWLLEYARKGLLCHHVHTPAIDDDPLAPWLRAFQAGIDQVE
jgi:hypothetical protein